MKCFKVIHEDNSIAYVSAESKEQAKKGAKAHTCELCEKKKLKQVEEMTEKEIADVFGIQSKKKK